MPQSSNESSPAKKTGSKQQGGKDTKPTSKQSSSAKKSRSEKQGGKDATPTSKQSSSAKKSRSEKQGGKDATPTSKQSSSAKKSRSEKQGFKDATPTSKQSSSAKKSRPEQQDGKDATPTSKQSSPAKKSRSEQQDGKDSTRKKKNNDQLEGVKKKRVKGSLTQADKKIIDSYFAAFSASADISASFASDCMNKCYGYHKENNNYYYSLIELASKSERKLEDIDIRLAGNRIVVARIQSSPPKGIKVCWINGERPANQSDRELIKSLDQEKPTNRSARELIKSLQSCLNADQLREIKEEVAKKGYWSVPETLLKQNPGLRQCEGVELKPENIPNGPTLDRAKELFKQSPEMLEIFCSLKIQELISHQKNKRLQAPATQINLSIITQAGRMIAVINANLKFDSSNCFAVTLIDYTNDKVASICDAIDKASWLKDQVSKTQIRFADRLIEKDLVFRYFLDEKISYGLLPEEVETRIKRSGEVNFWEGFAYERKRKEPIDYGAALDAMDNVLFTEEETYKDNPLKPSVQRLAAFREGIEQKKHLDKVIQNQKLGRGTLLHLPTGYGKTFIMFMAMAQHREALRQAGKAIKPYLIVVKANNVAQAWGENLKSLNRTMGNQPTHNIFDITKPDSLELLDFADGGKGSWPHLKEKIVKTAFLEFCSSPDALANKELKPVAVAINSLSLQNAVNLIFDPHLLFKSHDEAAVFFMLFKLSGVVSTKGYVIKDEAYWEERLTNLINSVNEDFEKINQYLEVQNESGEFVIKSIKRFLGLDSRNFDAGISYAKIMQISEDDQWYHELLEKNKNLRRLLQKLCGHTDFIDQLRDLYYLLAFFKQAESEFEVVSQKGKIDRDKLLKFKVQVGGKKMTVLQLLSHYKERQVQAINQYRALLDRFDGLILDESEQVLSLASHNKTGASKKRAKAKDSSPSATDILLDMAMSYQRACQLGSALNPLIIAASATPFPNEMNEYFLHMELLLAKAMNQNDSLYCALKRKWSSFELAIDSEVNEEGVPQYKKAIAQKDFIESCFQKWIRMLYRAAVSYEPPQKEITNQTEEKIVPVICNDEIVKYAPMEKSQTLNLIKGFYEGILKTTSFVSIDKKEGSILPQLSLSEKNAFYADTHEQATTLVMRLTDYFESQGYERDAIQIGLFYEDNFVKNQDKTSAEYKAYENATYNVDRRCNRRAFNNIARIGDFFSHLKHVLHSQGENSLSWNDVLNKTRLIDKIQARESDGDLLKQLEQESKNFFPSPGNHKNWLSLSSKDRKRKMGRFIDFLRLVIDLERYSEENLISDFAAELGKSFKSYLPKRFQQESDIRKAFSRFKERYTAAFKDHNSSKKPGKENGPWASNPFKNFIHLFLHYLTKVLQFNIFIFGEAGTSGMRIDADRLIILSGAWTEGRLTQVKGRVGRAKGSENRRCIIYSPLSNTLFEYLILRYYVKKAAYDRFVRSSDPLAFTDIAGPLVLAREIGRYYWQKFNREDPTTYVDDSVHTKVNGFIAADRAYLELGAYEKAGRIIPKDVKSAWQEFMHDEDVQRPRASMTDPVTLLGQPQDPADPDFDLSGIVDSWGEEFSRYIEMYASTKGFIRNKHEGVVGSMLRYLVDEGTFTLSTVWRPTRQLVDTNPTLPMLRYAPKTSGEQRIESVFSRVIPYNHPRTNGGAVHINTTGLETSLRTEKSFYTETMSEGGKSIDIQYKAEILRVEWPKDMPDDLYIELAVDPVNPVSQIHIEPLTLNGHEYELFGEIAGGHHETSTHWWTYRRNGDGFYRIDDLAERIDSINAHPGHGKSRIFRFVKKQKMAELQSLRPKRLINRNANCFINAAFQLADSAELRTAILAFKQSIDQQTINHLPNFPIDQLYKLYGTASKKLTAERPEIIPLDRLYEDNVSPELKKFVDKSKRQVILILPTRGISAKVFTDGSMDGDIDIVKWMDGHRKLVKEHFGDYQFIVILGLNRELDNEEQLPGVMEEIKRMQQSVLQADNQGALHIIPAPFAWQTKDRLDGKVVPLGQMRNYCLEKASSVYSYVTSPDHCGQQREKVALMSMDGDTCLNIDSLRAMLYKPRYRLTVKTGGYEMWCTPHSFMSICQKNQDPSRVDHFSAKEWSIYWRTLVSHLSIEMSARLTGSTRKLVGFGGRSSYCHLGYFSEPSIFVSPELTSKLFDHHRKCREEDPNHSFFTASTNQKAAFGFWDNEGRSFRRFLNDMVDANDPIKIDSLGPSYTDPRERPLLFNHERFAIPAPSHRKLKQQLTQGELAWVISNMHAQSQHLIKPRVAGSNIATFLRRPLFLVRGFASYFYANNFLRLLNLGPRRSRLLSHYLFKRYETPNHKPEAALLEEFSCSKEAFEDFIDRNFFPYREERAEDKDSLEFRKYAAMLAHWARIVSGVLCEWFTDTYQGEKIDENRYKPMTFPDTYPIKALQAVKQEEAATTPSTAEPVAVNRDEVLRRLLSYFEAKSEGDYKLFPSASVHVKELSKRPVFLALIDYKDQLIVFIEKNAGSNSSTEIDEILDYANTIRPSSPAMGVVVDTSQSRVAIDLRCRYAGNTRSQHLQMIGGDLFSFDQLEGVANESAEEVNRNVLARQGVFAAPVSDVSPGAARRVHQTVSSVLSNSR